jgi:hypothetical protein
MALNLPSLQSLPPIFTGKLYTIHGVIDYSYYNKTPLVELQNLQESENSQQTEKKIDEPDIPSPVVIQQKIKNIKQHYLQNIKQHYLQTAQLYNFYSNE